MLSSIKNYTFEKIKKISDLIHHNFLILLVLIYFFAAIFPDLGVQLQHTQLGTFTLSGVTIQASLSMLFLTSLLFNAGIGVNTDEFKYLSRSPWVLISGLVVNTLVPIVFLFLLSLLFSHHFNHGLQIILVSMALIAAMPIAGSSTAWTQNSNGDMALALGLVLLSTIFSPFISPLIFEIGEQMTSGDFAHALDSMEGLSTGLFLMFCVLIPSILGMIIRYTIGFIYIEKIKPILKLSNSVILLILNYANASVSLPQVIAQPDWGFLVLTFAIVIAMSAISFGSGWYLAKLFKVNRAQRLSLMFGLGMTNNGTGLVLAALTLANYPQVLFPIIIYNLVQHLAAGLVDRFNSTPPPTAGVAHEMSLINKELSASQWQNQQI